MYEKAERRKEGREEMQGYGGGKEGKGRDRKGKEGKGEERKGKEGKERDRKRKQGKLKTGMGGSLSLLW